MEKGSPLKQMKKGLRMFVRNEKLTDADWVELLEIRRKSIKSTMDRFTLEKLKDTKCLEINGSFYEIHGSAKTIANPSSLSLQTPGIFYVNPHAKEEVREDFFGREIIKGGIKRGWGLTRSGTWILVEVAYYSDYSGHGERLHEYAASVRITKCSIAEIIKKTGEDPMKIWFIIGLEIKKWEERAKASYNEVANVRRMIDIEELAFGLTGKNPKEVF
jgi:hypothetical protein